MPCSSPGHLSTAAAVRAGGVLLLLAGALVTAPRPGDAWRQLVEPAATTDPTAPLLAVVALSVWALLAWLALGAALVCASHLPGLTGRAAGAVAARVTPVLLRRTVEVALGAGLALGATGVPPAGADTPAGGAPGAVSLDWPSTSSAEASRPATGSVTSSAPPSSSVTRSAATDRAVTSGAASDSAATSSAASRPVVVVAPGDTLWHLAAHSLRAAGDPAPSAAAIAAAWPSWWAANRDAVGEDPDLLRPGTLLQAPPPH